MRETLLKLIELQDVDLKIKSIAQTLETEPEALNSLKEELSLAKKDLEEAKKQMEEKEKEKRNAEWELEDCETRIKKSKQRMMEVKTNKEYQALLAEIDELKKIASEWEEKIIIALDEVEEAKKVVDEKEQKVKELEKRLIEAQKRLEAQFTHLKQELVDLRKKREEMAMHIPTEILKRYDFIRQHRNGQAIVAVNDGVCEGCHMHIPPQNYNELLRVDKLMTCPSCQRIIYWKGLLENSNNKEEVSA